MTLALLLASAMPPQPPPPAQGESASFSADVTSDKTASKQPVDTAPTLAITIVPPAGETEGVAPNPDRAAVAGRADPSASAPLRPAIDAGAVPRRSRDDIGSDGPEPASDAETTVPIAATSPTPSAGPDVGFGPASVGAQVAAALQEIGLDMPSRPSAGTVSDAAAPPPSASTAPAARDANGAAPSGPARSMTIRLNPEHLGPVSITLRKTPEGVDIQIAVASREALLALERDRHVLTAAVEALGDRRGHIVVASPDSTPDRDRAAAGGAPDSPWRPNDDAASTGGRHARQGPRPDQPASSTSRSHDTSPDPQTRPGSRDGSLYV